MSPKATSKRKPQESAPSSPADDHEPLAPPPEAGNGHSGEEETETPQPEEEPAQVQVVMKGSDRAVRAAAGRLSGRSAKPAPVVTPANEPEPPDIDPNADLLSDGKNMVIVTRQYPRVLHTHQGKIPTNTRVGGKYGCPTSISEIEADVFARFGGRKYKCSIHPDTSNWENTILGSFTIEHPDPDSEPYIEGITDVEPPRDEPEIPSGTDPTLHETDQLVKLRQDAERRIERARLRKEAMTMEREAKRLEAELDEDTNGKPAPQVPVGESEEVKKLRADLAATQAALAEKKVNDRFDKLEDSITKLATAIATSATAKPAVSSDESFAMQMVKQSQQHSKDMMEFMKSAAKPPAAPETLDAMLERQIKLNSAFGKKEDSRMTQFQERLIEDALDRLTNGGSDERGGEPDEEQDVIKYGIKQLTPVLKTYVEKVMEKEAASGAAVTPERVKEIYAEQAAKVARELEAKMRADGMRIAVGPDGKTMALPAPRGKGAVVPPRHAGTKVVSQHRTSEGVVKTVHVTPENMKKKEEEPKLEGDDVVKFAEFPGIGDNGGTLKIPIPPPPGDLKYDRKGVVNFILDSIRSEIRQQIPQNTPNDSFVPGDALELLDSEILDRIAKVDSGEQVEKILAEWGDQKKIDEIKAAGNDEAVKSWLRRLVITIGDAYRSAVQGKGA